MQFLYDENASQNEIKIVEDSYRYLFKVRRHKVGERVALRNLADNFIYFYRIESISKKEAMLVLQDKKELIVAAKKYLHIGWCVVDPKTIEKTLPMLNEMGVAKITFIYCDRSQRNFKINLERLKKILINSSQQCGRSQMMKLEVLDSIDEYFARYPKSAVLDFGGVSLQSNEFESIVIGCEGGFSNNEREQFSRKAIYGLDTPLVLKSESAAVAVAAIKII
jgi:16S rRNA (uracil1498-N3)-methyltransferase